MTCSRLSPYTEQIIIIIRYGINKYDRRLYLIVRPFLSASNLSNILEPTTNITMDGETKLSQSMLLTSSPYL